MHTASPVPPPPSTYVADSHPRTPAPPAKAALFSQETAPDLAAVPAPHSSVNGSNRPLLLVRYLLTRPPPPPPTTSSSGQEPVHAALLPRSRWAGYLAGGRATSSAGQAERISGEEEEVRTPEKGEDSGGEASCVGAWRWDA
ncbi:hypothetical protein GUJ93_ZPchr0006g40704 [Zizania palustris]|uniref:Uncharacterized protein n=1 Tax=Zizania palustris TaxID=103762 RepID=A0A8J5TCB4_ZIZPA|nr:hypothetical protein GUJ93_ZPchr0006g40704 [Zizania palustris]